MISKKPAFMKSIQYAGKEMIFQAPKPLFWRAIMNNDHGNGFGFDSSGWYAASLIPPRVADISVEDKEKHVNVSFVYDLSIHLDARVTVTYTVYANVSMKIHSAYVGVKVLIDIPIHPISFKMSVDYQHIEWYTNGPKLC